MSRKKMSGEKSGAKINKKRVRSLQGHIEHVCKISRSESKNGVDICRGINWGFQLEPACTRKVFGGCP